MLRHRLSHTKYPNGKRNKQLIPLTSFNRNWGHFLYFLKTRVIIIIVVMTLNFSNRTIVSLFRRHTYFHIIIPLSFSYSIQGFSESAYKSPVSCKLTVQKYEREKAETIINFKPFYLPLKYRIISPEQKNSPGSFEPRLNIN